MTEHYTAPHEVREHIESLKAYEPGLSIAEIQQRYGCERIIKMASNENPLGTSPLVQECLKRASSLVFRYPQGGNPRLVKALAARHGVEEKCVVIGNGSDELIDLFMRVRGVPGQHNVVAFKPCFSMYTVQARICGLELRQAPLNRDFSFSFDDLRKQVDEQTVLVFITTPDNPSGYCPTAEEVEAFAASLPAGCLLVVDEAYMDFTDEHIYSLLIRGTHLPNVAFLRTFSKSYGLAGLRLGYGIVPAAFADYVWRARLPFSVNVLAEEAGLAALEDKVFYQQALREVRHGREQLLRGLMSMGCRVWSSHANFLMFIPPEGQESLAVYESLLTRGFIIRSLKSYDLPHFLRVSIGTEEENTLFLRAFAELLA